jgi:hypothetical protein
MTADTGRPAPTRTGGPGTAGAGYGFSYVFLLLTLGAGTSPVGGRIKTPHTWALRASDLPLERRAATA